MFRKGKPVGKDCGQPLQGSAIMLRAVGLDKTISRIGSEMTIVGKLICKDAIKVYGLVDGELYASNALIADGARLEGEIVAEELTIAGRVKGDIHALRVKLQGTAVVEGDICTRTRGLKDARGRRTLHLNHGQAPMPKARSHRCAHSPWPLSIGNQRTAAHLTQSQKKALEEVCRSLLPPASRSLRWAL